MRKVYVVSPTQPINAAVIAAAAAAGAAEIANGVSARMDIANPAYPLVYEEADPVDSVAEAKKALVPLKGKASYTAAEVQTILKKVIEILT